MPSEPALLSCPGEVQVPFSQVLHMEREHGQLSLTSDLRASSSTCHRWQGVGGGGHLSCPHHHMTDEGNVASHPTLTPSGPAYPPGASANRVNSTVCVCASVCTHVCVCAVPTESGRGHQPPPPVGITGTVSCLLLVQLMELQSSG